VSDAEPTPGDAPGPEPARHNITDRTVTEVVERTRDVIRKTREMLESSRELLDRVRHRDNPGGVPDSASDDDEAGRPASPVDTTG
jgi:hypothetical protein